MATDTIIKTFFNTEGYSQTFHNSHLNFWLSHDEALCNLRNPRHPFDFKPTVSWADSDDLFGLYSYSRLI